MMTISYLPLCCFFAVVAGLRWTRASSLPFSLLLFTLLWLFSLRNNSALQSNTEMECFFVGRNTKNKESNACILFVGSGFTPNNSAAFVCRSGFHKRKWRQRCKLWLCWLRGGGGYYYYFWYFMEYKQRLSYLSSVSSVLCKWRQLINTVYYIYLKAMHLRISAKLW